MRVEDLFSLYTAVIKLFIM